MAPIKKKNHKAKKKTVAKRSASRKQQTLQTYTPSMYNEEEMFQPDNNDDKESRVPQILIVLGFLGMAIALGVLWKKTIDEAANQNFPIILTVIAALLVLFWFFFLR